VKGFILAAGYGERLKPLTNARPKCLMPVLNVPSICYALLLLKEAGILDAIVNLHYRRDDVIRFFEEQGTFGMNIQFSVEKTILGTGGGVKRCEAWLGQEDFVLINSDVVQDTKLEGLISCHRDSDAQATLLLHPTVEARRIGPVGISGDRVVDFSNLLGTGIASDQIYTGTAVLSSAIFPFLKTSPSGIVETGFKGLIAHGSIGYCEHRGLWQDIGNLGAYHSVQVGRMRDVMRLHDRMSGTLGIQPRMIAPSARMGADSMVFDSVVGEGVCMGKGVWFEKSVALPGACIPDGTRVHHAIVLEDKMIPMDS
jgi:mannose-1-phosphate guanylyltransferase